MLEQPWCKAVALRLRVVTRSEKDGRRNKDVTEVTVAPMFGHEFRHYEKRIGIKHQQYVENKLDLAPFPAEAKLEYMGTCKHLTWGKSGHP